MSHDGFENTASQCFDGLSSKHENGISINSLTRKDFEDYTTARRLDLVVDKATLAEQSTDRKLSGTIDFRGGLTRIPGLVIETGDKPSRYPLPEEALPQTGEGALSELNQRIINQSVKKVQDSMTPAEQQQLKQDGAKYVEEKRAYEEEMRRVMTLKMIPRGPEFWPKMPSKPQSLVQYEAAIDREIERQVSRIVTK